MTTRSTTPPVARRGSTDRPSGGRPNASLDVAAAARHLGVGERYVRRLVLERRVAYYKVGKYVRFDPADLDAFVAAGRVDAEP